MAHRAARPHSRLVRLLLPVIVSFLVQVPAVFFTWGDGRRPVLREYDSAGIFAAKLTIMLIGPLALLAARRFPGPVVAIVAVAASVDLLMAGDSDGPPYIAFAFAIGSAIVRGARVWAWATIAVAWIGTLVAASLLQISWQPWRVVGISIGILLIVGMAEFVRTARERRDQVAEAIAGRRQTEVQAERVRIARELHDVLAHSLSQINVQASVGLHLIEKQPEKAADALASIKETSKTALDEVRSVLGVLRAEGGADPGAPLVPEPDLSRLTGLVASVGSQGIAVTLDNALGDVPKATQLAIYRIVQESLTNVVRHAHASRATVTLTEVDDVFIIDVRDDGAGSVHVSDGRGLLGMRERAELLGGSLSAGPTEDGFVVTARIPRKEQQ
jgi:signal transduction histidine kinase